MYQICAIEEDEFEEIREAALERINRRFKKGDIFDIICKEVPYKNISTVEFSLVITEETSMWPKNIDSTRGASAFIEELRAAAMEVAELNRMVYLVIHPPKNGPGRH